MKFKYEFSLHCCFRSCNLTNTKTDVLRLTRHLLNKCAANRIISQQECMVLLLELDLVMCSDKFDHILLSDLTKITTRKQKDKSIKQQYATRSVDHSLSLHQYYHKLKQQDPLKCYDSWYIPHYSGVDKDYRYPYTKTFVKSMFTIHKPWVGKPDIDLSDWMSSFKSYLKSEDCPKSVKTQCSRAELNYFMKVSADDVVADEPPLNQDDTPSDIVDYLRLMQTYSSNPLNETLKFDFGINYNWSQKRFVSPFETGCFISLSKYVTLTSVVII